MFTFKQNQISGAIFDMDGTMFDTESLRFQTLKNASKEMIGVAFSDIYLMQCLGLSAKSAEQLAQTQYGQEIPYTDIRARADQLELAHVRQHGVPIKKGLVQVLERLKKSGLKMAVATSSRRAIAEEYLINANVYKYFDVIICGDEVKQGKPDPEIFRTATQQLNLNPQDCLMFEDSENGLCSAALAGGCTVLLEDIKAPSAKMLAQADYSYQSLEAFLQDLDDFVPRLNMPELNTTFPQSLNLHTVGIHGFGAIGGGYLAQILSHWDGYTRPHKMIASTRNPLYLSAVNTLGHYCIRYHQCAYDQRIENITLIDGHDIGQMQDMYCSCRLVALCVPEEALATEVDVLAQGLYARYLHQDNATLTLLIIMNKVDAKYEVLRRLEQALTELSDRSTAQHIIATHEFCDTVVNRMVSKLSNQKLCRQLSIKYNIAKQQQDPTFNFADADEFDHSASEQAQQAYAYLEDLRDHFQPYQGIQQLDLVLFQAEMDMPIYVENNSTLLSKMRQLILVDEIEDIQLIKNRLWNGVHAMIAWLAALREHSSIGVALADPIVEEFMYALLDEVQASLTAQVPQQVHNLHAFAESFKASCQQAYHDPCVRVARDPLRKLCANERVLSSIEQQIMQQGSYSALQKGVVLGYVYAIQHAECEHANALVHLDVQLKNTNLDSEIAQQFYDNCSTQIMDVLEQRLSYTELIQSNLNSAFMTNLEIQKPLDV